MKLLNRFNISRDTKNGPRKFSLEMTMSGVISLAVVVLLGMCWVFILGILLGRGYRPENAVPQLAQMMPTTEANKLPNETPGSEPKVLKPEDLTFMEDDQSKDGEVVADSTQKAPADAKKSPEQASSLKSHDLTDARATPPASSPQAAAVPARPSQPQPAVKPAPVKTPPPSRPAAAEPARVKPTAEPKSPFEKRSGERYRATYQVASFPSKEQANIMAKRLGDKGFKATVHEAKSSNRSVFRVNIQIRGSEADLAAELKKTGEKGPILLDKKPL